MKFQTPAWRFKSPGPINDDAVEDFFDLALSIASQGSFQDVLEAFKSEFSFGKSTTWSSDAGWAKTDLHGWMSKASENAPKFIGAFVDCCEALAKNDTDVPDANIINEILEKHKAGYRVEGDTLVSTALTSPAPKGLGPYKASLKSPTEVNPTRPMPAKSLKIFLCHSSGDKPAVKKLHAFLREHNHEPWLDAVDLIAGDTWEVEIKKAVRESDVVLVCLSQASVTKKGFAQKEIKFAIDVAYEQPEGHIYIIPTKLEECEVPERISQWQWVNLFAEDGYDRLLRALAKRVSQLSK